MKKKGKETQPPRNYSKGRNFSREALSIIIFKYIYIFLKKENYKFRHDRF